MMKEDRIMKIVGILKDRYGNRARGEVASTSSRKPFEVLVSAVISQRNKDEVTERVAGGLLKQARTPAKMKCLGRKGIERAIKSANFYKTKADRIYRISEIVTDRYGGKVPSTRDEIVKLPGVGGKTADIVLLVSHGKDVIPVDTHVSVISNRLGWTDSENGEKIREDLHKIFPKRMRGYVNIILVEFGKEFCRKHRPKCDPCPIREMCPYPDKNL